MAAVDDDRLAAEVLGGLERLASPRSSPFALTEMVNVGIGRPSALFAIATTRLESTPPERYDTTGTSARKPPLHAP